MKQQEICGLNCQHRDTEKCEHCKVVFCEVFDMNCTLNRNCETCATFNEYSLSN